MLLHFELVTIQNLMIKYTSYNTLYWQHQLFEQDVDINLTGEIIYLKSKNKTKVKEHEWSSTWHLTFYSTRLKFKIVKNLLAQIIKPLVKAMLKKSHTNKVVIIVFMQ